MKNPPVWPKPLSEADELEIRAAIAEREPKESAFARFEDDREVKLDRAGAMSIRGGAEQVMDWPRLMMRKDAARYMGRSLRKFDEIKHLFKTEENGLIRYDRVLIDRYVDLSKAAA